MGLFGKKPTPIIVGVCGRSCSGKSVAIRRLEELYPHKILRIPLDRFFKRSIPQHELDKNGWETPDTLRFDRLIDSVKKLKKGESTHIPRTGWTEVFDLKVTPKPIIVVEGYLIFANEELLGLFDKKIFFDVSDTNLLYRRTVRDGSIHKMEYTMQKVIPISKQYEALQRSKADVVIDGNLSKEQVLKKINDYLELNM